jgi:hypothetical protein
MIIYDYAVNNIDLEYIDDFIKYMKKRKLNKRTRRNFTH